MLIIRRLSVPPLRAFRDLAPAVTLLIMSMVIASSSGCDDEVNTDPGAPRLRLMRDATMELPPFRDYAIAGDESGSMAGDTGGDQVAGSTGGEMAGTTAGSQSTSCVSGELRLLPSCGVERCLNAEWVVEQSSSERCNGHDDDCDGQIDESFSIGGMCFIDDAQGCRLEGEYICDPNTEAAMCRATSSTSSRPEVCDGVDNDCDQQVDEGFDENLQCCTNSSQCGGGVACVDGLCQEDDPSGPMIDPNSPLGTCGQPIWMPGFNIYSADGNSANKELSVINCTADEFDNGVLFLQTALGSEVVFAFSLPQTQRVRFSVELSLFASVVYVFEGQCSPERVESQYCDQSILGLGAEAPRGADLVFEAQANQLYYVVLDTKLDLVEIAELLGGAGNIGSVPFVLTFSAAP